mmetsp:Transcript_5082/g.15254  ORF Transcript_5082/g.15254 Transcript_5082/m.15254 type:complete len:309 (-) Transcript_5082:85-1011(-)
MWSVKLVSDTLNGNKGLTLPGHAVHLFDDRDGYSPHDVRADPIRPAFSDLRVAHRHSFFVPDVNPSFPQRRPRELEANPAVHALLVEVVGRLDQARGDAGGVGVEPILLERWRIVRLPGLYALFPQLLLGHVEQHLGPFLDLGLVQLLQLPRDGFPSLVLVLPDAPVRAERREAHGNVTPSLQELWLEPLSLLHQDGVPRANLHLAAIARVQHHPPLKHADPLVVVKGEPGLRPRAVDHHPRNRDPVILAGNVPSELRDLELRGICNHFVPSYDLRHSVRDEHADRLRLEGAREQRTTRHLWWWWSCC